MLTNLEIFIIAVAMSIDAFSVSFGVGCRYSTFRHYFRLAWHFGLFQFLMPLIGAYLGKAVSAYFSRMDIVAAAILFYISYHMIKEGMNSDDKCVISDPTKGMSLVMLSLATSMDALGVGVSLTLYKGSVLYPAIVIGVVCLLFSILGVFMGSRTKNYFGKWAEFLGAAVLIIIGLKFLIF